MTYKVRGKANGPAGEIVRLEGPHGAQVMRSTGRRWTGAAQTIFLDTLGATCNVVMACEAAGFSKGSIYRRRARDPVFAEQWQIALAQGYARLEMAAVRRANDVLDGYLPDPDTPMPAIAFKDILQLLQLHRANVLAAAGGGGGGRAGTRSRARTMEEIRASILVKLNAIETARREAGGIPYPGRDGGGGDGR